MRILHLSDTHGHLPRLRGSFDIVVHSGDFLPDCNDPEQRISRQMGQMMWVEENIEDLKKWIGNYPFLFTLGNHDFFNPFHLESVLNSNGIKAICLHEQIVSYKNVNFYGFPWIPGINGTYNYETTEQFMLERVDEMCQKLNETYVDVIVAHCPPSNCLDLDYQRKNFGSSAIALAFDYKINPDMLPSVYMCGHIHAAHGITMRGDLLVSNAATTQHIIAL